MRELLTKFIVSNLQKKKELLKDQFEKSRNLVGVRHCFLDGLLPEEMALQISNAFPDYSVMRSMQSFRERKYTSKSFDNFNPILKEMTFAIQKDVVIQIIDEITGIPNQLADPTLYAGGLSMMPRNCFLNPHVDNSHNSDRSFYRTLNLLYYITPNWKMENGGNLELWDTKVRNKVTIESRFNRFVLMETNPWSWHSVSLVKVDNSRNCISNYYFSKKSPTGRDYFHVTSFSERPDEKWKYPIFLLDNIIRQSTRFVFSHGLGKKDIYQSSKVK